MASLEFKVTSAVPDCPPIVVQQFAGVQDRLATVTPNDLLQARDAKGEFLLSDQYRKSDNAESLASAFHKCMDYAKSLQVPLNASRLTQSARKLGVGTRSVGKTGQLNLLSVPDSPTNWELDFSEGKVVYQEIPAETAQNLLRDKQARHLQAEGLLGITIPANIRELTKKILDKAADVIRVLVGVIEGEIRAIIDFVIDEVKFVLEVVHKTAEQLFDFVEMIFAKAGATFTQIFKWLGFVFDWESILRTKDLLANNFKGYMGFLEGVADSIRTISENNLTTKESSIDTLSNQLAAMVGDGSSTGDFIEKRKSIEPRLLSALANNPVFNATINNASSTTISLSSASLVMGAGASSPFDSIIGKIQDLAQTVEKAPEFNQALECMKNLDGSPDQIFKQLLSALLKILQGIIKTIQAGVQGVLDNLAEIVSPIVAQLRKHLTTELDIPLVTTLYAWVTKSTSKMTLLDLMALIVAIPTTVLYKVIYGSAPDHLSIDKFVASSSTQSMHTRSSLGRETLTPFADAKSVAYLQLIIAGSISNAMYGYFIACVDYEPLNAPATPLTKTLSLLAVGSELIRQATFGEAYGYLNQELPSCDTTDGAAKIVWIYGCIGVLIDGLFLTLPEETSESWGVPAQVVYGIGHVAMLSTVAGKLSPLSLLAELSLMSTEVAKISRQQYQPAALLATIDVLFALTATALWISEALVDSSQSVAFMNNRAIAYVPGAVRPAG